jgi:D-hydroxyproline dehydrogenase subunit beta
LTLCQSFRARVSDEDICANRTQDRPSRSDAHTSQSYDLAVVGAGVCGLAHALAAARRGKRVVVVDRDAQANGASIRNFGFVTVTGQQAGDCWARAVIEAFLETDMGAECRLVEPRELTDYGPGLRANEFAGALHSPHEVRVESREAIPQLAAWLGERFGVTFLRETAVHSAIPPKLETSRGPVEAEAIIVCPGDDFTALHADRLARYGLTRCKLHMMRVRPERSDERLPALVTGSSR